MNRLHRPPATQNRLAEPLDSFIRWMSENGAKTLETTNQWEVLRVKTDNGMTLVIYKNKAGTLRWPEELKEAWNAFKSNQNWKGFIKVSKRNRNAGRIKALYARDGDLCFYCSNTVDRADASVEHVLSICHGGSNKLENLVLAHIDCNKRADDMPVVDKIRLRDELSKKDRFELVPNAMHVNQ